MSTENGQVAGVFLRQCPCVSALQRERCSSSTHNLRPQLHCSFLKAQPPRNHARREVGGPRCWFLSKQSHAQEQEPRSHAPAGGSPFPPLHLSLPLPFLHSVKLRETLAASPPRPPCQIFQRPLGLGFQRPNDGRQRRVHHMGKRVRKTRDGRGRGR